jgi:hypothetical protein
MNGNALVWAVSDWKHSFSVFLHGNGMEWNGMKTLDTAKWMVCLQCVDPKKYCSRQSLRPYLDKTVSTAQQLASKGPLRPVPRRRRVPSLQGKHLYWNLPGIWKQYKKVIENRSFLLYMFASCHVARYALMFMFTFANSAGQCLYIFFIKHL